METHVPDTMERWFPFVYVAALWIGAAMFSVKAARFRAVNRAKAEASAKFAYRLAVWPPLHFSLLCYWSCARAGHGAGFFPAAVESVGGLVLIVGMLVLYARLTIWLYWQGGGEFVFEHADLVGRRLGSPLVVKLELSLMMGGGLTAMTIAWLKGN